MPLGDGKRGGGPVGASGVVGAARGLEHAATRIADTYSNDRISPLCTPRARRLNPKVRVGGARTCRDLVRFRSEAEADVAADAEHVGVALPAVEREEDTEGGEQVAAA